ncbi:MAG: hypothetical protein C0594_08130 [Marinilabiliales bacterium]|nr:MAG: hypothetical protein C0594_08130 [Marinilabiliales bacterium]
MTDNTVAIRLSDIVYRNLKERVPAKITMLGKSMRPTINNKTRALLVSCNIQELKKGDLVVCGSGNHYVVHRLLKVRKNVDGHSLITKGDALLYKDRPWSESQYLGRIDSVYLRNNWKKLNSGFGYFMCILSPFTGLVYYIAGKFAKKA